MFVYILIILIHNTRAFVVYQPESASLNVGTVLFTKSDLTKKRWSKDKIKLLQARKFLQHLIPPPNLIDTVEEEYLNSLLSYYEESFRTVKREIKSPNINNIMNTALSDALGGYLKVWVLPITKYAYYGGTITMEKAINMFQVFEDIKKNLKTDGRSWRNPSENLLKSIAIDVISKTHIAPTRSMKNPCKNLAYYEKTDTDLTIPLPIINWDILPITIFVPLTNQSLVPISSPNSSKILMNYYDIAHNCMEAQNPTNSEHFKQKFQSWLSKDVAPHLNDDNLYVAFGSVLSLMNDSKKFCNNKCAKLKSDTIQALESPMHESKKYFIIIIILLVEIIWCLPSLFYVIRVRRRKRTRSVKGYFCNLFRRKPENDSNILPSYTKSKKTKHKYLSDYLHDDKKECGVKLAFKPRVKTLEVDVQHPSCDSKYISIKSSKSYDKNMLTYQASENKFLKKTSLRKILPEFDSIKNEPSNNICIEKSNFYDPVKVNRSSKSFNRRDLELTRTLTLIQDEQTIKEINYSQESILNKLQNEESKLQCKCCLKSDIGPQKCLSQCPCTTCLKEESNTTVNKNKTVPKMNPKLKTTFEKLKPKEKKQIHKTVMHSKVNEKVQPQKQSIEKNVIRTDCVKPSKVKNGKPLLRIRIEKPQTEIKVGITSLKDHSKIKPSKIPRLAVKRETKDTRNIEAKVDPSVQNNERLKVTKIILRKNNIKEKALDDTAIKRASTIDKKLNVTL